MPEMTEKEIEEAVEHDVKLLLESIEEQGIDPDGKQAEEPGILDVRLETH